MPKGISKQAKMAICAWKDCRRTFAVQRFRQANYRMSRCRKTAFRERLEGVRP